MRCRQNSCEFEILVDGEDQMDFGIDRHGEANR